MHSNISFTGLLELELNYLENTIERKSLKIVLDPNYSQWRIILKVVSANGSNKFKFMYPEIISNPPRMQYASLVHV